MTNLPREPLSFTDNQTLIKEARHYITATGGNPDDINSLEKAKSFMTSIARDCAKYGSN